MSRRGQSGNLLAQDSSSDVVLGVLCRVRLHRLSSGGYITKRGKRY